MQSDQQATIDRPTVASPSPAAASVLKSILLHVQDDSSFDQRLEAALSLARASSAHLSCVHVTPIQAYVAFDSFGGVFVMKDVIAALDEQETRLRSRIEDKLGQEDVSWDYEQVTGDVAAQIVCRSALADLVVTGREPHRHDFARPAIQLLGDLLHRSRSPLFIPGDDPASADATGRAVIAWDGSFAAANAVRSSLGLLMLASKVTVLQIVEEKDSQFPGTRMLEYLSRHGIHAELVTQEPPAGYTDQEAIAASLISYARGAGAAYLVMGGYSHSRAGEFIFGGVTRSVLRECPLPLVIAH